MKEDRGRKIMLSGGGTGGSVTPLLAFAAAYREIRPEASFVFVGSNGPEKKLVAEEKDIRFVRLLSGKWRRYFSWRNFFDAFRIVGAFLQGLYVIWQEKPRVLLTAGSFVSVPLAFAARMVGVPVLVHQQDIRPGLANRLMAKVAEVVTVTFEKSLADYGQRAVWTGNPRRPLAFVSRKEQVFAWYKLNEQRPLVLVFGGGTGAMAINEGIERSLPGLLDICQLILITGQGKSLSLEPEQRQAYEARGYREFELISQKELLEIMNASLLVVSRAGLGTFTELSLLRKPAIIIPIYESHQEENAAVFGSAGVALVMTEKDLAGQGLGQAIAGLVLDEKKREELSERIGRIMKEDAAAAWIKIVDGLIG